MEHCKPATCLSISCSLYSRALSTYSVLLEKVKEMCWPPGTTGTSVPSALWATNESRGIICRCVWRKERERQRGHGEELRKRGEDGKGDGEQKQRLKNRNLPFWSSFYLQAALVLATLAFLSLSLTTGKLSSVMPVLSRCRMPSRER